MILTVLRRDLTIRAFLPLWLLLAFASGSFVSIYGPVAQPLRRLLEQGSGVFFLGVFLMTPILFELGMSMFRNPWVRCSEYELGLPVSGRILIGARILGLILLGLAPLAVFWVTSFTLLGQPVATYLSLPAVATVAAAILLMVLSLHALAPDRSETPELPHYAVLAVGTGAAFAGAWLADGRVALLLIAASVLVGFWLWWSVPEAIILETYAPHEGAFAVVGPPLDRGNGAAPDLLMIERSRHVLHRWLLRRMIFHWDSLSLLFMSALLGIAWSALFVVLLIMVFNVSSLQVLHKVGHLPASRRVLFPYVVLPGLLCLCVFDTVDRIAGRAREGVEFSYRHRDLQFHLGVPARIWKFSIGHMPVVVRTPAGEEFQPSFQKLLLGIPLYVYNPYEVGPHSSPEFAVMQLSRAIAEAYGLNIGPDELARRYLGDRAAADVYIDEAELFRDYPAARKNRHQSSLHARLLLIGFLWFSVLFCFQIRPNRPPVSRARWWYHHWLQVAGVLFLVGIFIAWVATSLADWGAPRVAWGVLSSMALLHISASLPTNPILGWGVAGLIFACFYLILERRFMQMEVPPPLPTFGGWNYSQF